VGKSRTSALHLLIPASNPHLQLCRAIGSCLMMGFPVPIISGYALKDELDAAVSHLAKVRNILRYLNDLPSSADDDLILIIDGYDVFMTLPVDIMIRRYFQVVNSMNAKLEERFGPGSTRDQPGGAGDQPKQTILFGADKICWPIDNRRPACWAVPLDTGIPLNAWGVENGGMNENQPRWLNSGTIMGPVGDMRLFIAATMERILIDYDPDYEFRESDQKYMSDIWADQEYMRTVNDMTAKGEAPADGGPPNVPGGPDDRILPTFRPRQRTEYHVAMEYESALFETRAGNEPFIEHSTFSGPGYTTLVQRNFNHLPDFQPFDIQLPADTVASLTRLLKGIAGLQKLPFKPTELVRHLKLGTNVVTKHVYALFHCTGPKDFLNEMWPRLWYFPYGKSLLRAAVREGVKDRPLSDEMIDGRIWTMAHGFPASTPRSEDVGIESAGAWADVHDGWLTWTELCGEHEEELFGGPDGEVVMPGQRQREAEERQKKEDERKEQEAERLRMEDEARRKKEGGEVEMEGKVNNPLD
jgi:hypothetical protein